MRWPRHIGGSRTPAPPPMRRMRKGEAAPHRYVRVPDLAVSLTFSNFANVVNEVNNGQLITFGQEMGKWWYGAVVVLLLLHPWWIKAQRQQLTLEQAVRIALQKNSQVIAARLEMEKAKAQVREAFGTALPSLSLNGQYSWNVERPVFFFPDFRTGEIRPITVGSEHSFQTRIQLTQTLFNATAFTVIQNSYLYAQAARQQYQQTVSEVTVKVTQAFYRTLLAQEAERVLESSLKRMQEFARQVAVLYQEGLVSEYDKLRAEVAAAMLEPQLEEAQQRHRDALAALNLVMGVPVTQQVMLQGEFAVDTTFTIPEESELVQKVLQVHYGLQAMRTQMTIADKVVDLYQSEFFPMLFLFGQYTYQGQSDVFRFNAFQTAKSAAVGLQLSFSLFNGFQTTARVQQARLDYEKLRAAVHQYEQALQMQARSLAKRYRIALRKWRVQQKTLKTAERGYHIAQVRYREGVGTQLEVLDAEQNLRQVHLQYLQSIYEVIDIQTQLRSLLGTLAERF